MSNINLKKYQSLISFFMLTIGAILAAYALQTFLIPNTILDGGVTGISIIISKLTSIPLSILVIIINIPFVYIGYKNIGFGFLIRAVYSMILFSVFLSIFEGFDSITNQILLATVFGGALLGIGVGLVIHFGGCVDGTESVALVISKKTSLSVGQIVLIFNLIIYTTAGTIFGLDRAMYSLLTYFITFKVIDFVSEGLEQAKAALIVTEKGTDMADEIYKRLGRTVTKIKGKGLISGEKEVLYCVLTRMEVYELKKICQEMDQSSFITILEVSEIIGEHIKSNKKMKKIKKQGKLQIENSWNLWYISEGDYMKIEKVVTGPLEENCYILSNNNTCLVVDPGDDYQKIKEKIGDNKVLGVLITHSHFDHIGALRNFLTKRGVKIFKKSNTLEQDYQVGDFKFKCFYTPGHSKDSISFYFEEDKVMFVGDFVFKGSIGRCDLPGGDTKDMEKSINILKEYDPDTILYSGHGDDTILKEELENNPYFS